MLLLGIDLGTSFIKVSVVHSETKECIASAQCPDDEAPIKTVETGWAEQSPEQWWFHVKQAILKCHATQAYKPADIVSIGISYQMHGLVVVDSDLNVLCDSIIWCDSRAAFFGAAACDFIGPAKCQRKLLNSPGNFTAAKLAWIKANRPDVYTKVHRMLLPGDFIAMKLTGTTTTTPSALSEGVLWDFEDNCLSDDVMRYFGFAPHIIPTIQSVFSCHGQLTAQVSHDLSLSDKVIVAYKAGDQLNNTLALNCLNGGEVAATCGTSGVVSFLYESSKSHSGDGPPTASSLEGDIESNAANTFAYVTHTQTSPRLLKLLCLNGAGKMYNWVKSITHAPTYDVMNTEVASIPPGSDGLFFLPFGNGAERMLHGASVGAHFININGNLHTRGHMCRAVLEGICFAFRYGIELMINESSSSSSINNRSDTDNTGEETNSGDLLFSERRVQLSVVRACQANVFLSQPFLECFANTIHVKVELYKIDGASSAALAGGVGAGVFTSSCSQQGDTRISDASVSAPYIDEDLLRSVFTRDICTQCIPDENISSIYDQLYATWKEILLSKLTRDRKS